MSITAENNGGNFELIPAGTYMARCYSMVHIGTNSENMKGEMKMINKVRISLELPTEMKEFKPGEGLKPSSVSKEFTLSMNEKSNLRKFLEGWRGKGFTEDEAKKFDIAKLIGKTCMVSIIHKTSSKGKTYADINSASTLIKGMECPAQINPSFEFSYEPFDEAKFQTLPDFIKKRVVTSAEYLKLKDNNLGHDSVTNPVSTVDGSNLPF